MNLKRIFKLGSYLLVFSMFLSVSVFAQTTFYVNNGPTGNDGRNGLSATIPTPDDGVTGPKKTIGGAQGAIAAAVASDVIVVANTGISYAAATGEPATINVTKKLTFQSTGGIPEIGSTVNIATGALANTVTFNSGEFKLSGGLTLTSGEVVNSGLLLTINGGTVTVAAINTTTKVSGQLKYSGNVSFNYSAAYTTADEFPASGSFANFTITGAVAIVMKSTTASMTGVFTTGGTLDLGGNTLTITNTGAATHAFGANVTNGAFNFSLGGGNATINGAFSIPGITVSTSTSTARTLAIAQPTAVAGPIVVSGKASVTTSAALVSIGVANFSGNAIELSGSGTVTLSGTPTTVNGNVLLSSAVTAATGSQVVFAGATTVNGNVTNSAALTVSNAATWNGAVSGRIVFPDAAHVITGTLTNSTSISGAYGTTTDVDGFGNITFANTVNNVTIQGAMINSSSTSLSGTTAPADFSGNGLITFGNNITTADIRIDGGITNSTNFSGIDHANNTNNGQIVIGGAARATGSSIGSTANRVGALTNSSVGANDGDGNGDIVIGVGGAVTAPDGFYGTSVTVSGAGIGGYTTFGDENFDVSGNVVNSRNHNSASLLVGVAAEAGKTVTIGGNLTNSGIGTTNFNVAADGAVSITGTISSATNGTIAFPNITSGAFTAGGFTWSLGTFTIPVTHSVSMTFSAVDISGGTVNWLGAAGPDHVNVTGTASFTGGAITTTNRAAMNFTGTNITFGNSTSNATFATAATVMTFGLPVPTTLTTITIGALNPTIPALNVNNAGGLAEAVRFSGGTLNVTGTVTFTAGAVKLVGSTNIVSNGVFTNTSGYTTTDQARIVIAGTGAGAFTGAGSYGTVEFTGAAPAAGSNTLLAGNIYLTNGAVANGGNTITINNSTTTPTIVRNAGSFAQAPTFGSKVNVTYIGLDKGAGNELPAAADKLQNLTVATTNGAQAGKGIVDVTTTTVNGTLNVYANQTLNIPNGVTLTVKGSSIVLNGNIINVGTGALHFGSTTGTTITGAGYLPPIVVDANSVSNVIVGKAIINQYLGVDGVYGGGNDFDPTTTAAQGALTFANGTASASVNLAGVTDGSMLGAVTTANAGNTLTLGANLVATGALTHAAGTIAIGAFNFEQRGAAVGLGKTADAKFTGTGTLKLYQKDATTNTSFTITSTAAESTIDVPVEFNNADADAGQDDIILAGAPLILTNTLTVTDGELVLGQNLTLTGSTLTIAANGSSSGASVLRLNAATAPLTFTYSGTPTVANLRVSNDVTLAGTGTALTVSGTLTHDGGALDFATRTLTLTGNYTRTAGTYAATTGYMVWNSAGAFAQGDGFSIPNLSVLANLTVADKALTVSDNLKLANGVTLNHKPGTTARLSVGASGGAIPVIHVDGTGDLSDAPTFAQGEVSYNFEGANAVTIASGTKYWPNGTAANSVTLKNTAGAPNLILNDNRTINGVNSLNLVDGTLQINNSKTLTLADGITINIDALNAILDVDIDNAATTATGILVAPSVNLVYQTNAGNTGDEYTYPTVVNNVTMNVAGANINDARTIAGILDVNQNATIGANTTVNGPIDVAAGKTLTVNNAITVTNDVTVNGAIAGAGAFTFAGATGQTLTLPTAGAAIQTITLAMTGTNPVLNVVGGNINQTTTVNDIINFTNGILNMNDNTFIMNRPNVAANSGLGYNRAGVTGTNVGHIVGKVQRGAAVGDGGAGTNGRFEFPIGTIDGQYRPAFITFTPSYVVGNPTNIVVSHVNESPGGTVGLGDKTYPDFYWLMSTTPSSFTSTQRFDLDLQANNIGIPFTSEELIRILRRQDGSATANPWSQQGTDASYDNFMTVIGSDTTVVARTTSSQGGLVTQGSRLTLGIPVTAPEFTAPAAPLALTAAENVTSTVQFTAVPKGVSGTVSYSVLTGAPEWLTINATSGLVTFALADNYDAAGEHDFTVRATDNNGLTTDLVSKVTVSNANRAPVFTTALSDSSVNNGVAFTFTYVATDGDGDALTYSLVSGPTGAAVTAAGVLTWTPTFDQVGNSYNVEVKVKDAADSASTTASLTVVSARKRGDTDGDGSVLALDASLDLRITVGLDAAPAAGTEDFFGADANADGAIGSIDASWVLYYAVNDKYPDDSMPKNAIGNVELASAQVESNDEELGQLINLPIKLENSSNVLSTFVNLYIDEALADVEYVNANTPKGSIMMHNYENGILKVAIAGIEAMDNGNIVNVGIRLKDKESVLDIHGFAKLNGNMDVTFDNVSVRQVPAKFELSSNYPNPFNPTTNIKYQITENTQVKLVVYNMLGEVVKTVVNNVQEAGYYTAKWDGTNDYGSRVTSGVYIYRLQAGSFIATKKMNLIK